MSRSLLLVGVLQLAHAAPVTETPSAAPAVTTYSISNLTPKFFVRTEEFALNSTSCMQYRYTLSAERVKLRAYECLMDEGGYCVMNKHAFKRNATDNSGCVTLRPWYKQHRPYAFYFTLEKRERKYKPHKEHLRKLRERRIRQNGRIDATVVGELKLEGIMPCTETCDYRPRS